MSDGVDKVTQNIKAIYERRRAAVYALCLEYAARALEWFHDIQPPIQDSFGAFWRNQTAQASNRMITDAFIQGDIIGWFMAHTVEYGPYLELSNNRQNEAIRPVVNHFAGFFFEDIRKLYGETA